MTTGTSDCDCEYFSGPSSRLVDEEKIGKIDDVPTVMSQMYRRGMRFEEAVREFQSTFILAVLRDSKGNQCRASKKLGMETAAMPITIANANKESPFIFFS